MESSKLFLHNIILCAQEPTNAVEWLVAKCAKRATTLTESCQTIAQSYQKYLKDLQEKLHTRLQNSWESTGEPVTAPSLKKRIWFYLGFPLPHLASYAAATLSLKIFGLGVALLERTAYSAIQGTKFTLCKSIELLYAALCVINQVGKLLQAITGRCYNEWVAFPINGLSFKLFKRRLLPVHNYQCDLFARMTHTLFPQQAQKAALKTLPTLPPQAQLDLYRFLIECQNNPEDKLKLINGCYGLLVQKSGCFQKVSPIFAWEIIHRLAPTRTELPAWLQLFQKALVWYRESIIGTFGNLLVGKSPLEPFKFATPAAEEIRQKYQARILERGTVDLTDFLAAAKEIAPQMNDSSEYLLQILLYRRIYVLEKNKNADAAIQVLSAKARELFPQIAGTNLFSPEALKQCFGSHEEISLVLEEIGIHILEETVKAMETPQKTSPIELLPKLFVPLIEQYEEEALASLLLQNFPKALAKRQHQAIQAYNQMLEKLPPTFQRPASLVSLQEGLRKICADSD